MSRTPISRWSVDGAFGEGRLRVTARLGERTVDVPAWVERCRTSREPVAGERVEADGVALACKTGPLAPSGSRRHLVRRVLLRALPPAEAEFENLTWLRERLFETPRPVLALTLSRFGRPLRQLLLTEWVDGAVEFGAAWRDADGAERDALAAELGRELGRMHAVRFVHGDAYPRNVLVRSRDTEWRRLVFLDAWAVRPGARVSPERDLGAWLSRAVDDMTRDGIRRVLASYVVAREQNGRPVRSVSTWLGRVAAARRDELVRLERRRARLRGTPFPIAGWTPPSELP